MPRAQTPASDQPCPCGSARLFRACCATLFAADIAAWQRVSDAERRLVSAIAEYARVTWGPDLFSEAFRFFSIGTHSAESLRKSLPLFGPWVVFNWIPNWEEDEYTSVPDDWPTVPIATAWLASGAATASDFDQTFIVRAVDSPYSFLLVEQVRSGWSLSVRDLMTGRRFVVVDPEISARARPDDILLSAVLTLGGVSTLLGPAPYTLPTEQWFDVMELREFFSERAWLTRAELIGMEDELFDEYRKACDLGPSSILDSAGDEREPLHLAWAVSAPFHLVFDRLLPLSVCAEDENAVDIEDGPDGEPHVLMTWYELGLADPDDRNMIGFLYLEHGRLTADVPTRKLADRLITEIAARLGPAATLVDTRSSMPVRVHARECSLPVVKYRPGLRM